jgi:hypothetical protein
MVPSSGPSDTSTGGQTGGGGQLEGCGAFTLQLTFGLTPM